MQRLMMVRARCSALHIEESITMPIKYRHERTPDESLVAGSLPPERKPDVGVASLD